MPSVVFAGSKVKALKDRLSLNDVTEIISVNADPSSGAGVTAPLGSIAMDYLAGKVYKKTGSLATEWQELGAGLGGINYIENPDAESGTAGYSTYADAAGAQPVDGTGGTANITWTRSTTSPLRGVADFNLVKDAVNRQGQGVSYDFTIDAADQAKILTVSFDYEVLSGTYVTGDVAIYLIQDPSGTPVVIQPAGFRIQAGTIGTKLRQIATFQTASNVTSYRLCLHIASSSALAYTLAIDNVSVGPQVVQYGAPVTDWQIYTPTFTGFGTPASVEFQWRRVGDSLEVRGKFATGTVTATEARISFPYGLTAADTTKIPSLQLAGNWVRGQATAQYQVTLIEPSVSYFTFGFQTAGVSGLSKILGTGLTNGEAMSINARVPILGWSSTVQMSNDTDTRVVAASVSTGTGVNANNTTVQVPFGATVIDTHGGVGTNQYTVPVPGLYRVVAQTRTSFPTSNVSFNHTLSIFKSGVSAAQESFQGDGGNASGLTWMYGSVNTIIQCNAGDILTVRFGTNYNAGNSNTSLTMFSAERLSGPSAIAASETVAARYTIAAQVASSTTQPINYATRVFDTHGAVTTGASWKFTAPISGLYHVIASGACVTSSTSFYIYKNGVQSVDIGSQFSTGALSQSGMIQLLAGDYIDLRYGSSLNTTGTTTQNWMSVTRIGN